MDVDKISLSLKSRSKLGIIFSFNLALTHRPNSGLEFRHIGWLYQQCVSHLSSFGWMKLIRPYVSLYVRMHFVLPFVLADVIQLAVTGVRRP